MTIEAHNETPEAGPWRKDIVNAPRDRYLWICYRGPWMPIKESIATIEQIEHMGLTIIGWAEVIRPEQLKQDGVI